MGVVSKNKNGLWWRRWWLFYQNGSFIQLLLLLFFSSALIFPISSSPLSDGPWGPTDPIANPNATIFVNGPFLNNGTTTTTTKTLIRITVLTDRLLRIEQAYYAAVAAATNGTTESNISDHKSLLFENRKTIAIINRNLSIIPKYTVNVSKGNPQILTLQTKCLTLTYHIGQEFSSTTLQIQGLMYCRDNDDNDMTKKATTVKAKWTYYYGQQDTQNLLGTIRTLDKDNIVSLNCSLMTQQQIDTSHCEYGLISKSGYAIINDTLNYALSNNDDDWWDGLNSDIEDFYILGHGHEYKAALQEYRLLGGYIPLLPKYALGIWFSRWYDYTSTDLLSLIEQYEQYTIPLDVLVLDMNWHTKNDWTGYSFDRHLFPQMNDELAYIKHYNIAVTMNLHDANGVHVWEERYRDMCEAVYGKTTTCQQTGNYNKYNDTATVIPFSIINQTIAYALEDMVLKPLEDVGVDFWWIDWQSGEKGEGGAAGGKQNPTIWTAHIRSTNANRRRQEQQQRRRRRRRRRREERKDDYKEEMRRNMVLARWGGLGAHRYPLHFSGDVGSLNWDDLAYQPYFSMTATNVGAIWSHDIEGPMQDPELYTRWLQWGVVSGIMRSHDRGMAEGACFDKEPASCSVVVPWEVAPKYALANLKALRFRGTLIPYLYTAAFSAHMTGRWFTTPMYYDWPEMEGAYETASSRPDPKARYDSQYMFGDDIWVAPVVKPANQSTGLALMKLWVPPGMWIGLAGGFVLHGNADGTSSTELIADLNEIPMFARAGSVIPTIPVLPGNTVGLAMKPFEQLIWTVYLANGAPMFGTGSVYEDDGTDTAYYERDSYTITTATYNITHHKKCIDEKVRRLSSTSPFIDSSTSTTQILNFTVTTSGHCEKLPTSRATTIRLVNSLPPIRVVANGIIIPYSRFGKVMNTWSYTSKDSAVVIELASSKVSEGLQVLVDTPMGEVSAPDGIGYRIQRAISAKAALDEIQLTPGSQTGQDKLPAYLLLAASAASSLEYLAGLTQSAFQNALGTYPSYLEGALKTINDMKVDNPETRDRIDRAAALLESALQF